MIGILQCGQPKEDWRRQFGDNTQMLINWLQPELATVRFRVYRAFLGELPVDVTDCDSYMTTGSPYSVYDDLPWIHALLQFIQQLNTRRKKFLGICFGHQAIAKTLGGMVEKSARGWGLGILSNEVIKAQPWMQPRLDYLKLVANHQDQVTRLPLGAVRLAGSDFCPNYLVQYQDHFLGLQGHPEWPKAYLAAVIESRMGLLSSADYQAAAASLQYAPDSQLIARWVAAFLGCSVA